MVKFLETQRNIKFSVRKQKAGIYWKSVIDADIIAWLTVLLIVTLWTNGFSVYGVDNRLAVNVKKLAGNITQQFGAPELRVATIQGDKVYLNAGKNKYIREGAIYEIVADEGPVTDPLSRRKLGNIENHIAEIKIETVRDNYSIGQILDQYKGEQLLIAVGQKAVEKRSKISIAVMPFEYLNSRDTTTPRIAQEIMAAELVKTGRFIVAGSAKITHAAELIQPDSPGTVQFSKSIGRMLGVEYVLYGFIIDSPGYMEIQCRVHNTTDGIGVAAATVRIEAEFANQTK